MSKYKMVPVEPTPEMIDAGRSQSSFPLGVYKAMLAAAPAVQGEPVGWYTEDHLDDKSATTYSAEVAQRWRVKGWPVTPLYTAPQSAEQKPSLQSPPDDPLGGLEHRADGESNFYTLSRPTGNWVARIRFNGELHAHEQERILNAMLSDRNVRYGDGYHQGYWDARQKSPDVTQLVEALESILDMQERNYGHAIQTHIDLISLANAGREALAAHRKQGGES